MTQALPTSDEALLRRFASGEREALGLLAERYERQLLGLAKGLSGGSEDEAREAVQTAWIKVIRQAKSFRGRCAVRTWLYRIVINACRDRHRAQLRRPTADLIADDHLTAPNVLSHDPGARDMGAVVRAALDRLDPASRELLLLCHHRGLTNEQAAEILNTPVGTLKTRLRAARRELRSRLEPEVCCDA